MSSLSRRALRRTAMGLVLAAVSGGLSGCKQDDTVQRLVLDAFDRSIAAPRSFLFVDQDLTHKTAVSGAIADSQRYKLLLTVDGKSTWQKVVRDDSVADLFLDPSKVATYAGSGSSPAVDVVTDYQSLQSLLPKDVPPPPFGMLPKTEVLKPSLALAALQQGKWVLDRSGAPTLPTVGTSTEALATTPFLRPLLMLDAIRDEIAKAPAQVIKRYTKDDLSPTFKPKDDPFPKPGPGEERYDVRQGDLPQLTATSKGSKPDPPPDFSLRKLAVYVRDGKVVAVRENFDLLDRLQDLARLYQVQLQLKESAGTVTEQRIGQLIVQLAQAERPVPFRVHEEQMLLSYPADPPAVELPSPVVEADLSLLPGQGTAAAAATKKTG